MTADVAPPSPTTPALVEDPPVYSFGRIICRPFSDLWFDFKAYGIRNVPRTGGVVLVSNHQSYLDPVLLAVKLPRPLSFFAKSELFENPLLGWLIRSLNAFPVRRGEADVGAMKETIRRLQEGHVLNFYPEGHRSPDGEMLPMQPGIALIIRRAGVPVVPAVIDGSHRAWPKGQKVFKRHPIRLMYGLPMYDLHEHKGAEIVKRLDATLRGMFAELRERERKEGIDVGPIQPRRR
jgi:1-acyl-sn-glycerol-3-phosphate acyltransferase